MNVVVVMSSNLPDRLSETFGLVVDVFTGPHQTQKAGAKVLELKTRTGGAEHHWCVVRAAK